MEKLITNLKISVVFLLCLSCSSSKVRRNYVLYFNNSGNPSKSISCSIRDAKNGLREVTKSFFDNKGVKEKTIVEKYIVNQNGRYKLTDNGKLDTILSIVNQKCTNNLQNQEMEDITSTKYCYKGLKSISIKGKNYPNLHFFLKTKGKGHSILSKVYFDSNFILIMEEYIDGYGDSYKIEIVDSPASTHF